MVDRAVGHAFEVTPVVQMERGGALVRFRRRNTLTRGAVYLGNNGCAGLSPVFEPLIDSKK
jgi:hypothetical protein